MINRQTASFKAVWFARYRRTVMLNIKEIAERVSKRIYVDDGLLLSKFISEKFAEALIAEIAKQNEPVARICSGWQLFFIGSEPIAEVVRKHGLKIGDGLYTFPPTAEQIANETAEAIARMLENGSFLSTESKVALAANGAAKAIRNGAWKEFKK